MEYVLETDPDRRRRDSLLEPGLTSVSSGSRQIV